MVSRPDPAWSGFKVGEINPYLFVGANPISLIDLLRLEIFRVCCNGWDKQHFSKVLHQVIDLQGYQIAGGEDPGPLAINPHADTACSGISQATAEGRAVPRC